MARHRRTLTIETVQEGSTSSNPENERAIIDALLTLTSAPLSDQLRRLQRWLDPPLHDQRMIFVPLAVAAPFASRHSPDCAPVMVPAALTLHCWFAWPL